MLFALYATSSVMRQPTLPSISASRSQVLRGDKKIAWFFRQKHPLAIRSTNGLSPVTRASWAKEDASENPGLTFFFAVSKRDVREAHDRKKLKRWMREAVRRTPALRKIAEDARNSKVRVYLMLRVAEAPGLSVNWKSILRDALIVGPLLVHQLKGRSNVEMPVLRKKGA